MNICVIPARGGSKRIPRKNIKLFHGKPIIAYSIDTAIKSKCFDKVIVSTDDDEIAEVAKKYGAEGIYSILNNKNIRHISFDDWTKIDTEEVKHGEPKGKPREKYTYVDEMLSVIN